MAVQWSRMWRFACLRDEKELRVSLTVFYILTFFSESELGKVKQTDIIIFSYHFHILRFIKKQIFLNLETDFKFSVAFL